MEEKKRKTEAEVVGEHQERLVEERTRCQGMKRSTVLNGGVSYNISTPT